MLDAPSYFRAFFIVLDNRAEANISRVRICETENVASLQHLPVNLYPSLEFTYTRVFSCSVDPFSKKDWYDVKAPAMFNIRNLGKTLVTRTQGTSKCFYVHDVCVSTQI